ncbi:MAG: CYTH domain-containing protein [Gammaproteobacteria bacterium]
MAIEIERKYLVSSDEWRESCQHTIEIRQAYLANTANASIRIRVSDNRAHINLKSTHSLMAREEYDYEIPLAEGTQMMERLCEGYMISKTRHHVIHREQLWEIDEFHAHNKGLIVAEIELDSAAQNVQIPPWLGVEVTDFPRFYNHWLSKRPFCLWREDERHG